MKTIYLDHAATTYVDPRVLEVMLPYFNEMYGNPSSIHHKGQEARRAVDTARRSVADNLNCEPRDIIFTGSGTESINLAIKGVCFAKESKGKHIITNKAEHSAVLRTCEYLEQNHGFEVTYIDVDEYGMVSPKSISDTIREDTILCSVMYANNEVGTINPIAEIGIICHEKGVLFHTDACQAACSLDLDVQALNVDMMTLNGSKIYGPKGVGVLYRKKGINLIPMILGGEGQEYRLRSGTENVSGIMGMSKALELVQAEKGDLTSGENARLIELRDYLTFEILERIPDSELNGHPTQRLPNNVNISFDGIDGESLLMRLDMEGICATSGSACTSGSLDPSHVLLAMGKTEDTANAALRLTLGHCNTRKQIDQVLEILPTIIADLREKSPIYSGN